MLPAAPQYYSDDLNHHDVVYVNYEDLIWGSGVAKISQVGHTPDCQLIL